MNSDISRLLEEWEYLPGQIAVRKFKAKDGSEKIQLRVDLGILQMNAEGRPDGKLPFGHPTLFEHFQHRLERHTTETGSAEGFKLSAEDCSKLQQEAIQFHHRYICLYQLKDYTGVLRDTERNLRVFDFVSKHAESPELSWALQQLKPQLLMMQIRARGAQVLTEEAYDRAIAVVEEGLDQIRGFYQEVARPDLIDMSGELHSLESWLQELRSNRPLSAREKLEVALAEAVKREDYEQAALVRDAIRTLDTTSANDA
ncbi:MAG TPA: hypothetical protein VEH27_08075 [Methylomirabilota bacterium]|nr:hypothetical protein [Methylomirabilota bacterium]